MGWYYEMEVILNMTVGGRMGIRGGAVLNDGRGAYHDNAYHDNNETQRLNIMTAFKYNVITIT